MSPTLAKRLADLPLKMLRIESETALKNLQDARRRHGQVLERAIQLAGYSKGQACHELGKVTGDDIAPSQLSAWIGGTEHAQTWRFQQHPRLGPALLLAQAETQGGVVVRHVIEIQEARA